MCVVVVNGYDVVIVNLCGLEMFVDFVVEFGFCVKVVMVEEVVVVVDVVVVIVFLCVID